MGKKEKEQKEKKIFHNENPGANADWLSPWMLYSFKESFAHTFTFAYMLYLQNVLKFMSNEPTDSKGMAEGDINKINLI